MFVLPVFIKTLYGGWKESVTLAETRAAEILVGSWDINVFIIFMNIIHYQFHVVPWEISLDIFAKITVLADYYHA